MSDTLRPNYTTLDDVAAYLGSTVTGSGALAPSDQAAINLLIPRVSRFIETKTKQVFGQEGSHSAPITRDLYVDSAYIALRPYLIELVSVTLDDGPYPLSTTQYYLDTRGVTPDGRTPPYGTLVLHNYLRSSWFETGFDSPFQWQQYTPNMSNVRKATISGVWGWPAIPDDIQHAATVLVARNFKARDAGFSDVVGTLQPGQPAYTRVVPTDVAEILEAYRPRRVNL